MLRHRENHDKMWRRLSSGIAKPRKVKHSLINFADLIPKNSTDWKRTSVQSEAIYPMLFVWETACLRWSIVQYLCEKNCRKCLELPYEYDVDDSKQYSYWLCFNLYCCDCIIMLLLNIKTASHQSWIGGKAYTKGKCLFHATPFTKYRKASNRRLYY